AAFGAAVKDFKKLGGDAGFTFSGAFSDGLVSGFKALPTELKAAVAEGIAVSIAAACAPIGAALNGVLLAVIGLGGIGLGIGRQLNNPKVVEAGKQLGADLKAQLTSATSGFTDPLVAGILILDRSLSGTLKNLAADFDELAPHVETLAR